MTTVNDIQAVETQFINSLGAGSSATGHLYTMLESVTESRDTTVLGRAIMRAEKKGDTAAAGIVRFATAQVFPQAKVKRQDGKPATITIKGIKPDTEALARLKTAVDKKLSIRHATFRKVVKGEAGQKNEPAYIADPKKYAETVATKASAAQIDAMIAALQAVRPNAKG